jgi:hypothetical protein
MDDDDDDDEYDDAFFFPAPPPPDDDDLMDETWKWVHVMPVTDIAKYSARKCPSGRDILAPYSQHTRARYRPHPPPPPPPPPPPAATQ